MYAKRAWPTDTQTLIVRVHQTHPDYKSATNNYFCTRFFWHSFRYVRIYVHICVCVCVRLGLGLGLGLGFIIKQCRYI